MHIVFSEAGFGSETTILTSFIIIQSRKILIFFFTEIAALTIVLKLQMCPQV